nr:copia protein [Tanacetum cinerariifolium]
MTLPNPQRHVVPTTVLTKSKLVPITSARPVTDAVPKTHLTRPRQAKTVVTKPYSPSRSHINCSPSPKASNFLPKVTAVKALMGYPQHALKDKRVIDSGCSRHMTRNMSYLSNFEEIKGGYVAFGGNLKGEKAKEENVQQYVLFPVWSSSSKNPKNTNGDAAFKEKEPKFEKKKLESEVHVSPSSSAHNKKHDDNTKKETKGKSLVESFTRCRNLSAEFEYFSDNNINEVNAAGNLILAAGQIFTDNTYTFSADDMPELEDITYSDDEEDVGAEANFTNLETSITVSPILTTRVHKDHLVTQIIGDLSLGTKWVFRNKKDERGIVVKNKARLVAQGHTQEEEIYYEEVFAPVVRIEAIRLFLAYASFMGFMVYQMDVKSAFLYGTIKEEVYACQPPGFKDPDYHDKDKYVAEILRKFGLTDGKSASTPIDTEKPLLKDPDGEDVDVHTYRSMIGSLILISWQRKKQMVVATSSTEAELKNNQEKDKIGTKPDKNRKRGEAEKSLKQLQ